MNAIRTSLVLVLAAALVAVILNACDTSSDDDPGLEIDPDFIIAESFTAQADSVVTTESGLKYLQIEAGTGVQTEAGDRVFVHYVGQLTDGGEFDNSYDRGEPLDFILGDSRLIPGFTEGVSLMREGETAQILIPPNLAYGASGSQSGNIPPNATIAFELELVELRK
ncbi:MAG: FKBP-type peptidyl-prolyl cis-trans isomerase [Rhodothermales bacterium]